MFWKSRIIPSFTLSVVVCFHYGYCDEVGTDPCTILCKTTLNLCHNGKSSSCNKETGICSGLYFEDEDGMVYGVGSNFQAVRCPIMIDEKLWVQSVADAYEAIYRSKLMLTFGIRDSNASTIKFHSSVIRSRSDEVDNLRKAVFETRKDRFIIVFNDIVVKYEKYNQLRLESMLAKTPHSFHDDREMKRLRSALSVYRDRDYFTYNVRTNI